MRIRKQSDGSARPGRIKPLKSGRLEPKVTVHVTIRDTPPDAQRLAAQREAVRTILAAMEHDCQPGDDRLV
jgi:hypothetical protein